MAQAFQITILYLVCIEVLSTKDLSNILKDQKLYKCTMTNSLLLVNTTFPYGYPPYLFRPEINTEHNRNFTKRQEPRASEQ